MALPLQQGAGLAIRAKETRGIEDPAIHQFLQPPLGLVIEHSRATKCMEVAVRIEPQLRGAVVTVGQLLAGIAQGLEMADGVGVLQSSHE
jgi:hypothetical protein